METQSEEAYQHSLPGQPEDNDSPPQNISQQSPPAGVSQQPSSASDSQQPPPVSGSQQPPPASDSQHLPSASGSQHPPPASDFQHPPPQNDYQKSPLPHDGYQQPPPAGVYHHQLGVYNSPPYIEHEAPPPAHPQQGWNPPPPQHQGYGGAPPAYSHTNTTVVVQPVTTVQQYSHHIFREIGVQIVCPHCSQTITTATRTDVGMVTWLACIFICIIGGFAGCFLIPFCLDGTKDIIHSCPLCRKAVGRFARM